MSPLRTIHTWAPVLLAVLLPLGCRAVRSTPDDLPPSALTVPPEPIDAGHVAQRLVDAVIQIESGGDPAKVGRHGERGLMQIKAGTWRDMTAKLFGSPLPFDRAFEPELNRRVGTAYLAHLQAVLLARRSDWQTDERTLLLAAYNAGPGRVRSGRYSLARMPRSTRDYVARASALHDVYLDDIACAVRARLRAAL